MSTTIDLREAAAALHTHVGPRLTASRLGGHQRLVATLQAHFEVDEPGAEYILAALARRQALRWEAARGLSRPCPGVLELFGEWLIQPECLQVQGAQLDHV